MDWFPSRLNRLAEEAWGHVLHSRPVNLFKAASTISLLTLVSRITGLVREQLIASAFGAGALTDAFNVAFRIPNLLRRLFAEGAFSQAFVPVLAASKQTEGEAATKRMIDHVASLLSLVLLITCVIGVIGAPALVWVMASGLKPDSMDAAVVMTRWMFPYIGFMSLVALSAGILNTWKHYLVPAATPVLLNVAMIAAAWWGAPWFKTLGIAPIYALAAGVMLGGLLQLLIQVPALVKLGMLPRLAWGWAALKEAWADPGSRRILKLMGPALLGVSVAQISLLINMQIASHLPAGSISWLSYADRLMEFPTAMLGVALGVVLTPQLSAAKAAKDDARYTAMLDWGLRLVLILTVPCAVALLTFAVPLVSVVFNYGAFSPRDVQQTTWALMSYGVGLLALVAIKILAPGFYAAQDIKTPVKIAICVLVLTQLLNVVLVPHLAHAGLALATSLGAIVNAAWLLRGLRRKGSYTPAPGWLRLLLQVATAAAVLAVYLWLLAQHLPWPAWQRTPVWRVGAFTGCAAGAAVLYFGVLRLTGMNLRSLLRRSV
jgi:putative peptidoglycan lipid II flippase